MRLFGGDTISNLMTRFNMPEDVPLQHGLVTRAIEQAQIKVEGYNFDIRKHLVEYDDVLNKQREIIYTKRKLMLGTDQNLSLKEDMLEKVGQSIATLVTMHMAKQYEQETQLNETIVADFTAVIPFDEHSQKHLAMQLQQLGEGHAKIEFLQAIAKDVYNKREEQLTEPVMREVERFASLSVIDNMWMDHLDAIENLRQGIGLRGYGQRDPLVEYKNEAYTMFELLVQGIDDEIVHRIYRIQVQGPTQQHTHIQTNTPASEVYQPVTIAADSAKAPTVKKGKDIQPAVSGNPKKNPGRNDPCWCGSGKKFKKCHGK